ncbi:MAG: type III-A CRISPR-associated RAMP protein Csm5 [Candidatus Bathyarchaeia archaeon]
MQWNEPITLRVRILSPVAIGTGEKCNTLGFIADGSKVLVVDEKAFISALTPRQREMFLQWLEPLAERLAFLRERERRARGNQAQLRTLRQQRQKTERSLSLKSFMSETLRMHQPAQWLRQTAKVVRYEVNAVSVPNRYEGFSLCLKTPDHRPYIPGSELKGAIRTAVLVQALTNATNLLSNLNNSLLREVPQIVNEIAQLKATLSSTGGDREREKIRRKMGELRGKLGELWRDTEQNLLRSGKSDAHYDIFRGIAVSDSEPLPTNTLRIYAAKRLGMGRDVTVFVEAIAPNSETTVTLSVARPDRWLKHMGLTDKSGWLDWQKLAQAIYEHSNAVLESIAQKFPQIRQRVNWLKSQNQPNSPLVCIGWGQGFLSVTMTDPLRRQHPQAYEALRQAMAQAIRQYERTKPNNFPKTLWVALDANNRPADLFGWAKLEVVSK